MTTKFSVDWTSTNAPVWYKVLEKYKDQHHSS